MNTQSRPVVRIDQLTKCYGELTALDSLTLSLDSGQILGLIGPNGAGKTTTIRILVGLALPTKGQASIGGADCVRDARRIKRLVGFMPDQFGSYDNMRVHEYLDFFGAAFGIGRRKRRRRIDEVLETTSSSGYRDRFVETLSHGMQQRVGIARTLLHDPDVLIFDEPANGLDPQARVQMRALLTKLAEMGKTLIVTSHILPELSRICHRVAILAQGKLCAEGTVDEIMKQVTTARLLEIQLRETVQLDEAMQVLAEFDHIKGTLEKSEPESRVRLQTTIPENRWHELLTALVQNEIIVTQFREIPTDLEDAYLTVTERADEEFAEEVAANA